MPGSGSSEGALWRRSGEGSAAEIDLRRFLDEMKKAPGRQRPGAFFLRLGSRLLRHQLLSFSGDVEAGDGLLRVEFVIEVEGDVLVVTEGVAVG